MPEQKTLDRAARRVAMAAIRWLASDGGDEQYEDLERLTLAFADLITEGGEPESGMTS